MTPTRLTEHDLRSMETSNNWTLRQLLEYTTETRISPEMTKPADALNLLAKSIKSLKYELAVTRAGLRQVTKERDRLSQRDFFVS